MSDSLKSGRSSVESVLASFRGAVITLAFSRPRPHPTERNPRDTSKATISLRLKARIDVSDDVLRRDTLVVDHTADGLSKHVGHGELLHLVTTLGVRNRVGEHNLRKG